MVGPHQGVGREGTAVVYGDWIFFFFLFKFKSKLESKTADPQVINTGCKLRSNDHLGNQSSLNFSCIHSSVLGAGKATCDKI